MCKVSVLIPAYNVELYLRPCLDSVLGQSLTDLEVICVDDASTDGTLSILREYAARDPRVKVLCHERNKGQACGRNLALSHAAGTYVYMLDADDMIVPGALEELVSLCAEQDLDVVGFEGRQFTEDPAFQRAAAQVVAVYEDTPVLDGREALRYCVENECFSPSVPTFMMRRAYLEEISLRFVEGILHEDVGYLFELIVRARRLRFLHRVYFLRRIRARSTMTTAFTDANIEGYLKSFSRSFDLEPVLRARYEDDPGLFSAVRRWQRDIFGRVRRLYLRAEKTVYPGRGGHVDEQTRRMFELVRLTATGRTRAEDILGPELCAQLETPLSGEISQVYICGAGQYADRMIDLAGALEVVIRGILVLEKQRGAYRGYPVYELGRDAVDDLPVIMGVSHYGQEAYRQALEAAGLRRVIYPAF